MGTIIQSNKIEKILGSLEDIKQAKAPAFLFERIQAKLATEITPDIGQTKRTSPRAALAITIVPFVILLDFVAFQWVEKKNIATVQYNDFRLSLENGLDEAVFYTGPETADAFDLVYY